MLKNTVKRVVFVIYSQAGEVMERFVFDVDRFPVVGEREQFTEMVRDELGLGGTGEGGERLRGVGVSAVDVEEQLRAAIRKLAYCGGKLGDLPEGCTFTVVVELKDGAEPPIGVCLIMKEASLCSVISKDHANMCHSILNPGSRPNRHCRLERKEKVNRLGVIWEVSKLYP